MPHFVSSSYYVDHSLQFDSIVSSAERKSATVLRTIVESVEGDSQLEKEVLSRLTQPELSPLLVESFEDLPNTYVVTVGFEVLPDDGLAYVRRKRLWARNANSSVLLVGNKVTRTTEKAS